MLALLMVVGLLLAAGIAVVTRLDLRMERIPGVFAALDGGARPAASGGSTAVIVVTDSAPAGQADSTAAAVVDDTGQPAEVVLIAEMENGSGSVVALRPVTAPGTDADRASPNEAYRAGGPSRLVHTVEDTTGLRVDHFFTFDLTGLPEMVDSLGGIRLPVADPAAGGDLRLRPVNGSQALAYARGQQGIAEGAAGRSYRWPTVVRALVLGMTQEMALHPLQIVGLLDVLGRTVRVDDTLGTAGLWSLIIRLGGMRSENVTFLSVPDTARAQQRTGSAELWGVLRAGPVPAEYVDQHPETKLRWRGPS